MVRGVGEEVEALPFDDRAFTLLLLPFGMDTASVYRAWDDLARPGRRATSGDGGNDLEAAARWWTAGWLEWKAVLAEVSGRRPRLAGSGSTWFVEGTLEELGLGRPVLQLGGRIGPAGRGAGGAVHWPDPPAGAEADGRSTVAGLLARRPPLPAGGFQHLLVLLLAHALAPLLDQGSHVDRGP